MALQYVPVYLFIYRCSLSPTVWGLTMAAYRTKLPANELALQTVLFVLGGTMVHSAACVINDICDVDFDRQVGELHAMKQ